jgi:EmrB/QacA subfamily drug resistance transporter
MSEPSIEKMQSVPSAGVNTPNLSIRYLVFGLIATALLLGSIAGSSVSVAFPVMITALNTSLILAGWVLSINQLIGTAAMPIAGKAADIFGRKSIFIASISLFTVGSLFCALSPNIGLLILSRAVQALGMGGLMPSASGIVADYFPKTRQQMLGLFTSIFPIGQIIGPNVGGWLVEEFGWRSIFWVNVPCGILIVAIAIWMLKKGLKQETKLDLTGTGLFSGGLFAIMVGLSEIGSSSLPGFLIPVLFTFGAALIISFVFWEKRVKEPIIDMSVLTQKPFLAANIYNFIYGGCVLGIMSLIPLYGVSVYALSTLQSGLILTPRSIGMIIMSTMTSISLPRWGYRWPMIFGTIVTVSTFIFLALEPDGFTFNRITVSGVTLLFIFLAFLGLGSGTAAPAANNACIELMPDRISTIIGIRGMFRQCGGAIGIAVATLILHNVDSMMTGFRIVFFCSAGLMALVIPCIFMMPKSQEITVGVPALQH